MKFSVLGPLRLADGNDYVPLNGIKLRAALGYLLLNANSVVATSKLQSALWGDNPPPTARKILQNAVSGLRRAMPPDNASAGLGPLITQQPGYLLRVGPEDVDLLRFRTLSERGQAALAAGRMTAAERDLRDALALWCGPALSDLVEHGYDWPELAALQNERFVALEGRMQAALALGNEQQVIATLEPVVGADPLRERLARQLMIALYRSGRQVDALEVYRRTRSALVDRLGLDPGPELRELEHAILGHHPALAVGGNGPPPPPVEIAAHPEPGASGAAAVPAASIAPALPSPPPPRPASTAVSVGERKRITAVLVRLEVTDTAASPETVGHLVDEAAAIVRDHVNRYGGRDHGRLGPLMLALFGTDRSREVDVQRAVRMAQDLAGLALDGVSARIVVTSGDAYVSRPRTAPAEGEFLVSGHLLDLALRLIADAQPGFVRVCPETRLACADDYEFGATGSADTGFDVEPVRFRFMGVIRQSQDAEQSLG